jgi:transposase-like protein
MDREWLAERLTAGRSIESIAREAGRAPSTVAYWANKHGLASAHGPRHRARGGIERAELENLVEQGLSIRRIATELDVSAATVRYWLRRHGLRTRLAAPRGDDGEDAAVVWQCPVHGWTRFHRAGGARLRCAACNAGAVMRRRREVKALLVAEHGGRCTRCGVRRVRGCAPVPPRRRGGEGVRDRRPRPHALAGVAARGGGQVRAPVRELPRDDRGGSRYPAGGPNIARRTADDSVVAQMRGSSMAEQSAVNR